MTDYDNDSGAAVVAVDTIGALNASEIRAQVATAHEFPRNLTRFRKEALEMVTLSPDIAEECIYALPRDGKVIRGPSARFAEIIASAYGNARAGARVISDDGDHVTAQGVFHDLQRNVMITYEVQRRIVDKNGKRYKPDMVGVTANAACSIALRNAILKGVPKAFWHPMYLAAESVKTGGIETLANRRSDAIKAFQTFGVSQGQILAVLGVDGTSDIGLDELATLGGLLRAIREGDTTAEEVFPPEESVVSKVRRQQASAGSSAQGQPAHDQAPRGEEKTAAQRRDTDVQKAPPAAPVSPITRVTNESAGQVAAQLDAINREMESLGENVDADPPASVATKADPCIIAPMQGAIMARLAQSGKSESDFAEHFGFGVASTPMSMFNAAREWSATAK